ncbi:MAG: RNA-dependent DNA polymerase [Planctomycetes bacterium]|nr:RNA-dependent DNA polymerase [Planctomycetota bacterium]
MKRYGNLWDALVSWENLLLAARKARRGKRDRSAVQRFEFDLEANLLALQKEMMNGFYSPGDFRTHWISRPKPRLISAAPYRDRVVHHALMNVLEPILERHFHPHSYACRSGKGTHSAADRLQRLLKHNRYFLQCDIQKYFPSIDHEILKGMIRRLIKDNRILWLADLVVDHSNEQESRCEYFSGDDLFAPYRRRRGLPIGNLTSQWLANWYLTPLDHFVTSKLGLGAYVRYCDDFILCHNRRSALMEAAGAIRQFLSGLRLRLHERKLQIQPSGLGATFVGFRLWSSHRLVRKANVRQFRRRVRWMRRAYANGIIQWTDIKPRLASWIGHARQADSERLIRRIASEWVFTRDSAEEQPRAARGKKGSGTFFDWPFWLYRHAKKLPSNHWWRGASCA